MTATKMRQLWRCSSAEAQVTVACLSLVGADKEKENGYAFFRLLFTVALKLKLQPKAGSYKTTTGNESEPKAQNWGCRATMRLSAVCYCILTTALSINVLLRQWWCR
ncbi:MAG TPA: hypothetical protein H9850_05185, partial [Candidatus Anaerobiospirillum pullistercoris]|nr:hypothetical protein [Candidatus Anaerobiospirillum pullistercoris]